MHPRRLILNVINALIYPQRLDLLAVNVANELPALATIAQKDLLLRYRQQWAAGSRPFETRDAGFRVYSEADEDGILLYLFSRIGFGNRRCVDIGASPGGRSNTANLILHHGFEALLIEANTKSVAHGRRYYANYPDTSVLPPTIVQAFITPQNVNRVVSEHGFSGDVDLLAIDIDGLDYWVWQAFDSIRPRVVLAEINRWWPADRAVTVPNTPGFVMPDTDPPYLYHGASLAAFVKLARVKGYRLIACNNRGFNVFFMRCGEGDADFPEISPDSCQPAAHFDDDHRARGMALLRKFEWVEV